MIVLNDQQLDIVRSAARERRDAYLQCVAKLPSEGRQPFSTGDVQAAAGRAQIMVLGLTTPEPAYHRE
jgi:hypothetical protein